MKKRNLLQISIGLLVLMILQLACGKSITNIISSVIPKESSSATDEVIVDSQDNEVTAQPVENAEALIIADFGFGQFEDRLGYGFLVQNTNQNAAIVNSEYQVAVYDANGVVLETDTGYLDYIFPNQSTGVGGEVYLDEGALVDRIEIQLSDGDAETTEIMDTITVAKEDFTRDDYSTYAVAELTSPYDRRANNIRISAIYFDENSKIVGGGYSYVTFLEGNSSSGAYVSGTSTVDASQVKIYPNLTSYSFYEDEIPSDSMPIELVKTGFAQSEYSVGYGFLVHNPNEAYIIDGSNYHITYYSTDQSVIGYTEGYINQILPGETQGVAIDTYLALDQTADSAVIHVLPGDYIQKQDELIFTTQNAVYVDDDYFPTITGEVVNPYTQQVSDVEVTAIAYDENDNIIGSGYAYLDFIPASGTSAAEVYVTVIGVPARVELYARLSSFSEFE